MEVTKWNTTYRMRRSRFIGGWIAFFRAVRFAWKHPHKVMVAVEQTSADEVDINLEYSGLPERSMMEVLVHLGEHSREMCNTQDSLTNLIKDN